MDGKQILARLVGRYGQQQGLYLFGEVCLLQTLGFDAFTRRHTPMQLKAIADQLKPLGGGEAVAVGVAVRVGGAVHAAGEIGRAHV